MDNINSIVMELWEEIIIFFEPLQTLIHIIDLYDTLVLCADLTKGYDESHDIKHHVEVYKNCIKIFSKLGIVSERLLHLIIFSSLVHDTIDHKYPNDIEIKTKKLSNFLENKFPKYHLEIKWIINNISFSKQLENGYPLHNDTVVQFARDIVSDADKIEALGKIGLERCRKYTEYKNPGADAKKINQLVVQHCHDKLIKLKDYYIRTDPGKEMARSGHNYIFEYLFGPKIIFPIF